MPKNIQNNQGERIKRIPQRKCVGCGTVKNKSELIRVVRSPENEISIDGKGKKSGRGAYLCRDSECLKKAIKSKRLDKNLNVKVSEEIFEELVEMMKNETDENL